MGLSYKDISSIISLIEKSDYDVVRMESGDFRLEMQKSASAEQWVSAPQLPVEPEAKAAAPQTVVTSSNPPPAARRDDIPEGCHAIRAPMLGVFYRTPSPDQAPFVNVGDTIGAEDTIGLIEVMKLFNSIPAGQSGKVVEIRAEHAKLVEYDDILMVIKPDC